MISETWRSSWWAGNDSHKCCCTSSSFQKTCWVLLLITSISSYSCARLPDKLQKRDAFCLNHLWISEHSVTESLLVLVVLSSVTCPSMNANSDQISCPISSEGNVEPIFVTLTCFQWQNTEALYQDDDKNSVASSVCGGFKTFRWVTQLFDELYEAVNPLLTSSSSHPKVQSKCDSSSCVMRPVDVKRMCPLFVCFSFFLQFTRKFTSLSFYKTIVLGKTSAENIYPSWSSGRFPLKLFLSL